MVANAYERLRFYQNISKIRSMIFKITAAFPGGCYRLVSQMRDAARSAKQNIREGYRKDSAGEFGRFIKISAGSLSELEGDVNDCFEDGLISEENHEELRNLFGKTNYQIDRYMDSLYLMEREGRWKKRFRAK